MSSSDLIEVVSLEKASFDSKIDLPPPQFSFPHSWVEYDHTEPHQVVARAKNATAILVNKCKISKDIIDQLPRLKIISVAATGINNIDLTYCQQKKIAVTNIKDYGTASIAEHTLLLFLALKRKLYHYKKAIDLNKWSDPKQKSFCYYDPISAFPITELAGSHLGIIGAGTLALEVGRLGHAFGMKILHNNRSPIQPKKHGPSYPYQQVSLETLLDTSDILSVHVPLTSETKDLITLEQIKRMKKSAYLINTARGGIVNEKDLAIAIKQNFIAGAASDVLTVEPPNDPEQPNPLLAIAHLPNVIITPHIAWAGSQSIKNAVYMALDNIEQFMKDL